MMSRRCLFGAMASAAGAAALPSFAASPKARRQVPGVFRQLGRH